MTGRADRHFFATLAIITAVYVILFTYYLDVTGLRVPINDVIWWLLYYMDHWLTGDWWTYLWAPHNEHRLMWSRLLMIADLEWFGGNAMAFLIFGIVCLLILLGAILREVAMSAIPREPKIVVAFLVVLLLVTSYNAIDCSVPQLGLYLHTCAFFVLSLVLMDGREEGGRFANLHRIAALPSAVAAALGVSGGLLAWPVLHWAAWRGGLGWRWIACIWVVGGVLIVAYLDGLSEKAVVTAFDPMTFLRLADYAIRFLGLPWSHSHSLVWFGRAVGAAVAAMGGYFILRFGLIGRPRNRLERIAVGILLFSFGMAALIALARVNTAPEREMPIRYALFTSMAQVALLLLAAPYLAKIWSGNRRRIMQAAILVFALLLTGQQILSGQAGAAGVAEYTHAYRRFAAGQWSPEIGRLLGTNKASDDRALTYITAHGLYRADP